MQQAINLLVFYAVVFSATALCYSIEVLYEECKSYYDVARFFKGKDVFQFDFNDFAEYHMFKNKQRSYFAKRLLFKKWHEEYTKQIHEKNPKLLSFINASLQKVFDLEDSPAFRVKIAQCLLRNKSTLFNELHRFNKLEKGYVVERFYKLFPETSETLPLLNLITEIVFDRLIHLAWYSKRVNENLLSILHPEEQKRVQLFLVAA